MKTVVIFGGSGFVGRHLIRRIAKNGYKIVVPYQHSINEAQLRLLGTTGQVIPLKFSKIQETMIINLLNSSDVIINLKTLWDENKITFHEGIYQFNKNLTNLIQKINKNISLIYFSGIGIDKKTKSERTKAIFKAENYIQENLSNVIIIRPGIIIGGGDPFFLRLLPIFRYSFFIPFFGAGEAKIQPVFVDDVAQAINKIIINKIRGNKIYELVGKEIFTFKNFYRFIAKSLSVKRVFFSIPFNLAKIIVKIIERTPVKLLTTEQLLLFEVDNIPSGKYNNFFDLEIEPQDIKEIIKKIVR